MDKPNSSKSTEFGSKNQCILSTLYTSIMVHLKAQHVNYLSRLVTLASPSFHSMVYDSCVCMHARWQCNSNGLPITACNFAETHMSASSSQSVTGAAVEMHIHLSTCRVNFYYIRRCANTRETRAGCAAQATLSTPPRRHPWTLQWLDWLCELTFTGTCGLLCDDVSASQCQLQQLPFCPPLTHTQRHSWWTTDWLHWPSWAKFPQSGLWRFLKLEITASSSASDHRLQQNRSVGSSSTCSS